jgi:hypothetical protein
MDKRTIQEQQTKIAELNSKIEKQANKLQENQKHYETKIAELQQLLKDRPMVIKGRKTTGEGEAY